MTGDRRLQSTTILLYAIAIVCGILALVAVGPLAIAPLIGRTRFGPGHIVYFGVMALSFGAPAALYMFVNAHLRRRKHWAAVMGIVVASIHAIAAVVVIGGAIWALPTVGPTVLIPAFAALVLGALAIAVIVNVSRVFTHLHELSPGEPAGFAPIIRS